MSGLREALVALADEWGRYGPMEHAVATALGIPVAYDDRSVAP